MHIKELPKIDLHCHLDGSLNIDIMREIVGRDDFVTHIDDNCNGLGEYLECFKTPIYCLSQRSYTKKLAYEFIKSLVDDNIKYVEVRFSPALIANANYCERDVLENVLAGLKQGEHEFGIKANVIICAMRHHTIQANIASFKLAKEYHNFGVCGLDLAGDENLYEMSAFKQLFTSASSLGVPYTIHAGECGSSQNIKSAVELGAKRIGHGVAMRDNTALQRHLSMHGIGVELCPTSNFQTKACSKASYPIREFLTNNVAVTLNTDNRTVSSTTLANEYSVVASEYALTHEDFKGIYMNSVEVSFADEHTKQSLLKFGKDITNLL